jgi:hypothetical protein
METHASNTGHSRFAAAALCAAHSQHFMEISPGAWD